MSTKTLLISSSSSNNKITHAWVIAKAMKLQKKTAFCVINMMFNQKQCATQSHGQVFSCQDNLIVYTKKIDTCFESLFFIYPHNDDISKSQ